MTRTHKATQAIGAVIMIIAGITAVMGFADMMPGASPDYQGYIFTNGTAMLIFILGGVAFSFGLVFYVVGRALAWWSE